MNIKENKCALKDNLSNLSHSWYINQEKYGS